MTFTEAAVEILRLAGRPLHYKKITELAIARNLLSHVGKAPELTMSSRLATAVKAERNETPIVKVKPGIFALRDFTKEMLALADDGEDIDVSQLPEAAPLPVGGEPSEQSVEGEEAPAMPKPRLPGADVFPAEEDDDQPILAGLDALDEAGDEDDKDDGRRGRRRRRRRGRSGAEETAMAGETEEGTARPEGEAAEPRAEARVEGGEQQGRGDRGDRDRGGRDRGGRGDRDRDRNRDRDRDRGDRHGRGGGGERDRGGDRDRDRDRGGDRGRAGLPQVDLSREPQEGDLLGRELSDAVHHVMSSGEAAPQTYGAIAGELVRRGRLSGDAAALAPTVAAAIRADARRMRTERARFRHVPGGVALTDWYLSRDAVYRERDAIRAAERQRFEVRRAFLRKIGDLPPAGFAELIATWLSAEGVGSLRGVRRPTSSAQEMHFAGVLRRGHEETRVAILVLRDPNARELAKERVIEMRGSLHHYGSASITWIVTLGVVPRTTRDEAQVPGTTPVAIWDGQGLAEAMEARRVGLVPVELPISSIDLDLLDALRGQTEMPNREWSSREGGREGGRDRGEPREPREPREQAQPANEGAAPESPPAAEAANGEAPASEGEASGEAPAEGGAQAEGEGGRRRRRRRRRRGGGADAAPAGEGAEGEDEAEPEAEGEAAPAEAASEQPAQPASAEPVEESPDRDDESPSDDDDEQGEEEQSDEDE